VAWPLPANRVNSSFGQRFGRAHQGLDLKARVGTPVHSVLPGQVIYAGEGLAGMEAVLIKHPGTWPPPTDTSPRWGSRWPEGGPRPDHCLTASQVGPLDPIFTLNPRWTQALNPLQLLPAAADLRKGSTAGLRGTVRLEHPLNHRRL